MNLPKKFEEYIRIGIVRKVSPDMSRANFLIKETNTTLEGLKEIVEKIGINQRNANSIIKDCYDIIIELVRAKMLKEGYNASGLGAHEAEVAFLSKIGFNDNNVAFVNEIRYFRNSVTYYGKILSEDYAKKVFVFMNKITPKLYKILEK